MWHSRDANISKCLDGMTSKSKSDYTKAFGDVSQPLFLSLSISLDDLNLVTNIVCNTVSFIRRPASDYTPL